jgi:hypothetical protein
MATHPDERRWPLGRYGLTVVLGTLFLVSWIGQFLVQLVQVTNEASQHGEPFSWGEFWPGFWQSTLENWQSEFLQLLTFVLLTAFFIHRGSAESKDSDDEMQVTLERIERRLEAIEHGGGRPDSAMSTTS